MSTFSLWTKRKDIVYKVLKLDYTDKPKNLIFVYSNPKLDSVMTKVPRHFDKVFNNVTTKSDLVMCYTVGNKTEQIVEVVK